MTALTPYGAVLTPPKGREHVTRPTQKLFRMWGKVTARQRVNPDYIIVGAKRGGSTSLAKWLTQHPQVSTLYPQLENRKGTYFFSNNHHLGEQWYRSHFPTQRTMQTRTKRHGKQIVGESSPYYLFHPHAPHRIRRYNPDTKIIALTRDPLERAHSHWAERTRAGTETLTFSEAILTEQERCNDHQTMLDNPDYVSFGHHMHGYATQSRYQDVLPTWKRLFGHKLLIIKSEDMYQNTPDIWKQVETFLNLDHHNIQFPVYNKKPKPELELTLEAQQAWNEAMNTNPSTL